MANKPKHPTASKRRILAVAELLGVAVTELEWEPIGIAFEMSGPSGGWRLEGVVNNDKHITAMAYSERELIKDVVRDVVYATQSREVERVRRDAISGAAKEKDSEIERLRLQVAHGGASQRERNRWLAEHVASLLRAVWAARDGKPPMREMNLLQEISQRALGDYMHCGYVPPEHAVVFKPMPKDELEQFLDQSPYRDLEMIRQAAGTGDTKRIVAMLNAIHNG